MKFDRFAIAFQVASECRNKQNSIEHGRRSSISHRCRQQRNILNQYWYTIVPYAFMQRSFSSNSFSLITVVFSYCLPSRACIDSRNENQNFHCCKSNNTSGIYFTIVFVFAGKSWISQNERFTCNKCCASRAISANLRPQRQKSIEQSEREYSVVFATIDRNGTAVHTIGSNTNVFGAQSTIE